MLLLLIQLHLLLSVLLLEILVLLHDACERLHSPVVQLKPQHLLEPGILIQEHFVDHSYSCGFEPFAFAQTLRLEFVYVRVFSINKVLSVGTMRVTGECESMDLLGFPIKDNSLVDRFRGHNILHSPDNLEAVLIQLLSTGNGGHAELVFKVVFADEGPHHIFEFVLVDVREVQDVLGLNWVQVLGHHLEQSDNKL